MKLESREVLAGAYPRGRKGQMLTHAVVVNDQGSDVEVLCRRVDFNNLADAGSFRDPNGRHQQPTCKTCAAKWRKAKGVSA